MSNYEFKNVKDFADFLNENFSSGVFNDLIQIIDYYRATIGGCNCSKNKRIKNLNEYYIYKIDNLSNQEANEIKKIKNVEKIQFYHPETNAIFKEF